MRELKFRVWIKDEERYYDESDEESYMIVPNGNVTYTSESYEEDGVWFNDTTSATNDVVVEQYTGLKDRNGKEIYEGDIIESTWNGDKAEVVWNDVEGEWEHYADFNTHSKYSGSVVIGNIHESPELLGGEK